MGMNKAGAALISFLIILLCTGVQRAKAQQFPLYSEYMFNILEINPAYAGFRNSIQFTSSYRKQFNGIKNSPETGVVSFDMPVGDTKVGIGVRLLSDKFSIMRTIGAQTAYSYYIETGETGRLYMGIQAGVLNTKANLTDLLVSDAGDPVFSQNQNHLVANFGSGLFYSNDKFYMGLSSPNLVRASLRQANIASTATEVEQNLHLYLNGGFLIYVNDNFVVKPSFLLRGVQGIPLQYDINGNIFYRDLLAFGLSYRSKSALAGLLNIKINSQFSVGYSYDYNTTRLNDFNKGTHEIMMRFQIPFWKDEPLPSFLF
jgi:type IX secretion system PorP/SprF family membrane protein